MQERSKAAEHTQSFSDFAALLNLSQINLLGRVIFRGCRGGRINLQDFVELRKLKTRLDHPGTSCKSQETTGVFQAGIASRYRANRCAVDVRDVGKIENYKSLARPDKRFGLLLEPAAVGAGVNTALHL